MEEKSLIRISQEELAEVYKQLAPAEYVKLVQQIETEQLWFYLTEYMRHLNDQTQEVLLDIDRIESVIRVVQKGFRYYSEKNDALRYYLYGYFAHQQEELLQKLYVIHNREQIERILTKKHLREIISYLYDHEIVQQKVLVNHLNVSKTNIDRIVQPLIDCGFVEKIKVGSAFYRMTSMGYEYYRNNMLQSQKTHIAIDAKVEGYDDCESFRMQNYEREDAGYDIVFTTNRRRIYQKEFSATVRYLESEQKDFDQSYLSEKRKFLIS